MFLDLKVLRLRIGAGSSNRLDIVDSKSTKDRLHIRESHLLRELDDKGLLLYHYRVWFQQGLATPYRSQQGWERYDRNGKLLDREVRYEPEGMPVSFH